MWNLPLFHTFPHTLVLSFKPPRMDFTPSQRGGWGVGYKDSLNCLCCVADCVCAGLHRGRHMYLTRCSPLTPPRNRSTTPVPSKLSEVSHINSLLHLGLVYPKSLRSNKTNSQESNVLSFAPPSLCPSLHLSASYFPPLGSHSKQAWNPIELAVEHVDHEKEIDLAGEITWVCRVWDYHVGLRKEEIKRQDES